ncbi:MAG: NAD-dependent epimerase/dehydratase family protein [Steroidobacteraceae bacterium]
MLVSGAGGFIGRWSVPALLRLGYDVHAVLSAKAGGVSSLRKLPAQLRGATIHTADLLDDSEIDALMGAVRPTHLLHFAWIATPGLYWHSAENFRWVAASERMLHRFSFHGGRRVMMAGSCAEYDWSRVELCDELLSPLVQEGDAGASNPYALCKIALQRSLSKFGSQEKLSTVWGRIFFQFGPDEHPDRLVPSVIRNLLLNRQAPVTHGRQVRSFLHVADVGDAFAAVLDGGLEGPVNIGSGERVVLADLIERIGRRIGRSDLLRPGARAAPAGEPAVLLPDIRRLSGEAHWQPRMTLDEALSDTIEWWRGTLAGSAAAAAER